MQLAVLLLQEAKVIKNACMALASIVEARGVLMTANCPMRSNLYMTRFGGLQESAFNNWTDFFSEVCAYQLLKEEGIENIISAYK